MKCNIKVFVIVMVFLFVFCSCSCGPSPNFSVQKNKGLYPDTNNFPNTKWVCNEIDMCIYMFGYDEKYMIGTYIVDSASYRIVATFEFGELNFEFYSSTEISTSEYSDSMIHCERTSCGFIYTSYTFDKGTETIVCTLRNCDPVNGERIPETLTFDKVDSIVLSSNTRWQAQEIDMYLDAFSDVDGYFSGQISIKGERCYVHALEIGNNNFYMLTIENGKVNNLIPGTTSPLIYLYLEITDSYIIAKVSDEYLTNPAAFPYWPYDNVAITFNPLPS